MESRIQRVTENHEKGYNCAQAVFCAYSDLFGMDEETAFRVSEGLGGGLGGMRDGTCGAVTAMYLLAGLKGSSGGVEKGLSKARTYQQAQELCKAFRDKNGSTLCSDLLGVTNPELEHPCAQSIRDAAELVERMLMESDD